MLLMRSLALASALSFACLSLAQDPVSTESYLRPPRMIEEAVMAPWQKNRSITYLSPDRTRYLLLPRAPLADISQMAKRYLNLGGIQIDPVASRQRTLTTRSSDGIIVVDLRTKAETPVALPTGLRVTDAVWSPDSKHIAFFAHYPDRTEVFVADPSNGKSRSISRSPALPTLSSTIEWVEDGRSIMTVLAPDGRKPAPNPKDVADSPRVQVSDDKPTRIRTYAGLMETPFEQDLLVHFGTGQLAKIDVQSGRVTPFRKPALIEAFDPQPDGKFCRVTLMEKPFSYLYPASMFPEREVVWDESGQEKLQIRKRALPEPPTATPAPAPGGRAGGQAAATNEKRSYAWHPSGLGLVYMKADGAGANLKDRVVLWKAPFGENDTEVLYESGTRIGSVRFGPDGKTLFITQTVEGKNRLSVVKPGGTPITLLETKADDDPIDLLTTVGPKTGTVVRLSTDGTTAYLSGSKIAEDPMKQAPQPFIDKVDLATGKREQIWQSNVDVYETASGLDDDLKELLVVRQSFSMVPQTYLVTRGAGETALTDNKDYVPDLTQARREYFTVTRNDGFKFRVKVTLPSWHVPYAKSPAFFWFYPGEFSTQAEYDRSLRRTNINTFNQVGGSNKAIMLRAGYVLVEPDCPIVGPATRMNDAYVPQLRNNLAAVIDELDRRGYVDRTRLAIGGHSYGAFSTANAMVHTPFFKAGIAGDGNYNRLLTPFGFQSDQRQIWEVRETYLSVSPILYADQMTGALLMYHGIDDQNMGTDPQNSELMFAALEALGKPAALYMYPYEDHGQIAKETVLDQWARWVAWLDKWVKK
ncbi:MAG: prolyl oligopeptidase family serine peptidase [Fimbriimonas sp.]